MAQINGNEILTEENWPEYITGGGGDGPPKTTTTPKMDGTAVIGDESKYAAGDHVHPTDTSRASALNMSAAQAAISALQEAVSALQTAVAGKITSADATTLFEALLLGAVLTSEQGLAGEIRKNQTTSKIEFILPLWAGDESEKPTTPKDTTVYFIESE